MTQADFKISDFSLIVFVGIKKFQLKRKKFDKKHIPIHIFVNFDRSNMFIVTVNIIYKSETTKKVLQKISRSDRFRFFRISTNPNRTKNSQFSKNNFHNQR